MEKAELLAKLLKAPEPDRSLDALVAVTLDWRFDDYEEGDLTPKGMAEKHGIEWLIDRMKNGSTTMWRHIPEFTRNYDAVMSLVDPVTAIRHFGLMTLPADSEWNSHAAVRLRNFPPSKLATSKFSLK